TGGRSHWYPRRHQGVCAAILPQAARAPRGPRSGWFRNSTRIELNVQVMCGPLTCDSKPISCVTQDGCRRYCNEHTTLRTTWMKSQLVRRRLELEDIGEVTVASFTDRKLLDEQSLQDISEQLVCLVDELGRKKLLLNFGNIQDISSLALGMLLRLN